MEKNEQSPLTLMWSAYRQSQFSSVESSLKTSTGLPSPYWLPNYLSSTVVESEGAGVVVGLLQNRYMDPTRGQFLSEDPIHIALGDPAMVKQFTGMDQQVYLTDPQMFNSYLYARGNPIVRRDSNGLASNSSDPGKNAAIVEIRKQIESIQAKINQIAVNIGRTGSQFYGAAWNPMSGASAIMNGSLPWYERGGAGIGTAVGIGSLLTGGGEAAAGVRSANLLKDLPGSTLVCRAGTCSAAEFVGGQGVKKAADGTLSGVSVFVGINGESKAQLLTKLPKSLQEMGAGFATLDQVRNAGATIQQAGRNLMHFEMGGLGADSFVQLFNSGF